MRIADELREYAQSWRDADNKTIAEYAKRLRLAGGEGE